MFTLSIAITKANARGLTILILCGLQGCFSPIALDRAVIEYDKATTDILSKQLLLNIARSHQHQPMHFTGVSNIAATFNFQFNAGATPAFTGETGSLLTPVFGGTISENLAGELRIYDNGRSGIYLNKPGDTEGYRLFRQAVLHLSSIQDGRKLFVEPLLFDRHWTVPSEALTVEQIATLQKEFKVEYHAERKQVTLTKRVSGHILLTNYDPTTLSNEERIQLQEEADKGAANDVSVDIRPGHPGGEWPIHGVFRLRSFHNVLNFIGQSISDDPEYTVAKHPRTPNVNENPVNTLALSVSDDEPATADMSIQFGDWYYALKAEPGYQWNREGFRLLCQIFQMTMTDLAQQGAPTITIAK